MPSNPYDAKGLLISSIEDDDRSYSSNPSASITDPLTVTTQAGGAVERAPARRSSGRPLHRADRRAQVVREGKDVTVLTYGTMVHVAEAAVRIAAVDAEIIDVRTMAPLDVDVLCTSVCKTGRCVVVHEATRFGGYGRSSSPRCRSIASGIWRRPCSASPAGTPLSARVRVGILSGPGAHCRGPQRSHGASMSQYVFKLPDLGEGTVEAEIVSWKVKPGDTVAEDDVVVEVMTEKAAVEVPAPVSGRVVSTTGVPGDMVPVARR